jgi:flagellar hook-length control protein FliK
VNLNLLNLFAPPATAQSSARGALSSRPPGASASISSGADLGDLMFGQLLAAQLQSSKVAVPLGSAAASSGLSAQLSAQLQAAIAQLLQDGTTLEQIVKGLASSLGSNFLTQLHLQAGVSANASAQAAVVTMLERALGPPSNGPPQATPAQTAAALVQRLVQVAGALAKVGADATGQQHDSLGTISDATAGDTPAPSTTAGILQAALVALQQIPAGGTSSAPPTTASGDPPSVQLQLGSQALGPPQAGSQPVPPPVPWVPTTAGAQAGGDAGPLASSVARTKALIAQTEANATSAPQQSLAQAPAPTVATDPALTLVGTGADTVIGRILARAANVAAQSASPAQSVTAQTATAVLQPHVAVAPAGSSAGGTPSDAMLASLLRTLQSALAALPPPKALPAQADASTSAAVPAAPANAPNVAFVATSLGIAPANPAVTPNVPGAAPQAAPPQPPVDPNAVVDQVLRGITLRTLSDGSQTVQMRLVPEALGNVTVNLQVQNGSVNATLLAQNTDVRDALLANQQMLSRSLADAGLRLSSFTVNLANNGQYQQPQNPYQPRFGTTRRYLGTTSSASDETIAAVPAYGPSSTQLAALQWLNALA